MKDKRHPADLISVTTAILSLGGLLVGGGVGLMLGSWMERTVPVSVLGGLVGLVGGGITGFFVSVRDQQDTNNYYPSQKRNGRSP